MEMIGAYEAKTHLPQLLERVARGGASDHYAARQTRSPVDSRDRRSRTGAASGRAHCRTAALSQASALAELMATIHEGHRY